MARTFKKQETWNAHEIFETAESFMKTASIVRATSLHDVRRIFEDNREMIVIPEEIGGVMQLPPPNHVMTLIPATVLEVFSLELYIKCLGLIKANSKLVGHDIVTLFNNLPSSERAIIKYRYESMELDPMEKIMEGFGEDVRPPLGKLLKGAREAFERLRYAYELTPETRSGGGVGALPALIRERIIELHPDWEKSF